MKRLTIWQNMYIFHKTNMTETKTLEVAKASELSDYMKKRLHDFMKSCEADGLYCNLSENETQIRFYKDAEKTIQVNTVSVALYHNLIEANQE